MTTSMALSPSAVQRALSTSSFRLREDPSHFGEAADTEQAAADVVQDASGLKHRERPGDRQPDRPPPRWRRPIKLQQEVNMARRFVDKVALISGGGSGIGRATAI